MFGAMRDPDTVKFPVMLAEPLTCNLSIVLSVVVPKSNLPLKAVVTVDELPIIVVLLPNPVSLVPITI
jgi:hypothetical protein